MNHFKRLLRWIDRCQLIWSIESYEQHIEEMLQEQRDLPRLIEQAEDDLKALRAELYDLASD